MIDLLPLPSGIYRHYKGHHYQVLGYAHDANADTLGEDPNMVMGWEPLGERFVVVYIGLELNDAHTGPRLAVRDHEDFHRMVCWNQKCGRYGMGTAIANTMNCSQCGFQLHPRFKFIGFSWEDQHA
jgi:hypothetical protein